MTIAVTHGAELVQFKFGQLELDAFTRKVFRPTPQSSGA